MQQASLPAPLKGFVEEVTNILNQNMEEGVLLPQVGESMRALVAQDNWLDPALAQPHPEHYQQFLLYADPDDRFSVVSFIWGPGQQTPIHDHTVWGAIGMLRGAETAQAFKIGKDGQPIPVAGEITLQPGDVEYVSPTLGDVHKVSNASRSQVSISIHVYGGNIGKVKRHVFPSEGGPAKEFISGYSNTGSQS